MRSLLLVVVGLFFFAVECQAKPPGRRPAARAAGLSSGCKRAQSSAQLIDAVFQQLRGHTLRAQFCQLYTDRVLGVRPEECGTLLAHPDGRVRFDYQKPVEKLFVFDGNQALFAEPEAAQVTYVDGFAQSPLAEAMAVMWGQGDWSKALSTRGKPIATNQATERRVTLIAEAAREQVERIEVTIDTQRCEVVFSDLIDKLGNTTRYRIYDKTLDVPVAADAFAYDIPKGFSVLHASR